MLARGENNYRSISWVRCFNTLSLSNNKTLTSAAAVAVVVATAAVVVVAATVAWLLYCC